MPVTAKHEGGKWRVVEAHTGRVAKTRSGTAADGGGHDSKKEAMNQARAINAYMKK